MKKAFLKLHIALILAGFTGIFGRLITLNAALISWYRLLISGLVMLIFVLVGGKIKKLPMEDRVKISLNGTLLGLHWLFFYGSIKYANISVGVVCFALSSFFTAVFAPLVNKTKLSTQEILLSSLTLCGIALIFGMDVHYRTGIILGVISSMISALYTLFNEKLVHRHDNTTIIFYQMAGGGLGLTLLMPLILYILPVKTLVPSMPDLFWLVVLSVFCTILLYFLITAALKKISSFTVSLTFNLEPLYTILLAIIIYKENKVLSIGFYIGLMLTLSSLGLQMYRVNKNRGAHKAIS